ncbi:hypothetical protein BgAZ_500470 [Babesia gibsoni]|uniref:Uncharacterized protein n=1 Tax=Babesia gibsoni TaxID=33632 RepID=A0AAD8LQL0_BABGI|nr:hypothetical protein BgAZ_500470 [Babesia gibsoni]
MQCAIAINPLPSEIRGDGEGVIPIGIDIMRLSAEGLQYQNQIYGSGFRTLVGPCDGYKIHKVTYGRNQILRCSLAHDDFIQGIEMYHNDNDIIVITHLKEKKIRFGKAGDLFEPLTPREYYHRLMEMGKPYTLDVNQTESTEEVDVEEMTLFGTSSYIYTCHYDTKVNKLIDGDRIIWEDANGSEHIMEVLSTGTRSPKLVSCRISTPDELRTGYYMGGKNGYSAVSFEEYLSHLEGGGRSEALASKIFKALKRLWRRQWQFS